MAPDSKKAKQTLKRVRARLSTVTALRSAAGNARIIDPTQYGYEADALMRQDSLRSHFGAMMSAAVERSAVAKPSGAEQETLTKPPMTKEEKRFSRGLLGTVARFHKTSRGVCVRSGDPRYQEWQRVKTADLKLTYALYLLENDMEHYRHLYREAAKAERPGGRMRYYQAPAPPIRIPELWLMYPELAAAQDIQQPPAEWRSEKILGVFPELWKSLHAARWPEIEAQTAKKKPAKPTPASKAPASSAPTMADPTAPKEDAIATTTAPGKATPPAAPGKAAPPAEPGKAAPPAEPGKAAPPVAPGKVAPPAAPGKAAPPAAPGKAPAAPGKAAPPPAPVKAAPPAAPGKAAPPAAPGKAAPPPAPGKAAAPPGKGGPPPAAKKVAAPPPKKAS